MRIIESQASDPGHCSCGWLEDDIRRDRSRHAYQHRLWRDGIPVAQTNWELIERHLPQWGDIVRITRQAREKGVRQLPRRLAQLAQREGGWDRPMYPDSRDWRDRRFPSAYVVIRNRHAVAYASIHEDYDTSVLSDIWIAGAHRGQGIGRTLAETVAEAEFGPESTVGDLIFMPTFTEAGYAFFRSVGGRLPPGYEVGGADEDRGRCL